MSTAPGETKNIVDALRRALQGPASQLASGFVLPSGSFTLSANPNSIQAPSGAANTYQSTIDVASVSGFTGLVTLTETDTLPVAGSVGIPTNTVQVAPPSPGGDGLAPVNITVTATTPTGTYTVTVTGTSTNSGQTTTASVTVTVVVGSGQTQTCVNNSDCGPGMECVNGVCYTCPVEGPIHSGPCVSRDTSLCRAENQGQPVQACGNCYCQECSGTQDCINKYGSNYCQTQQGACSSFQCVNGTCRCTECKGAGTPLSFQCPAEIDGLNVGVANTARGSFTVTNNDPNNIYQVNMTITPVGQQCLCCGLGPSLSNASGYLLGAGASQATTISVPFTCTTVNQCYQWNLTFNIKQLIGEVGRGQFGPTIQTFICPVKFCVKPCSSTAGAKAWLCADSGNTFSVAFTGCTDTGCTNCKASLGSVAAASCKCNPIPFTNCNSTGAGPYVRVYAVATGSGNICNTDCVGGSTTVHLTDGQTFCFQDLAGTGSFTQSVCCPAGCTSGCC